MMRPHWALGYMDFIECIKDEIDREREIGEGLHSLILFGSYVRGDFVEGVSDLDFFAVLERGHEGVIPRLKPILEDCTRGVNRITVDIPWEYVDNLDDPLNKGFPFKFLTFYQWDFLENHVVVYGKGIVELLPRYDWRDLARWRAETLLSSRERFRGNIQMLKLSAGEVIRLMALLNGGKGISKDDIQRALRGLGDGEAVEIFNAYLDGRDLGHSEEYWVGFITSRLEKILSVL